MDHKKIHTPSRRIVILLIVFIFSVVFYGFLFYRVILKSQAEDVKTFNIDGVSTDSVVETGSSTKSFNIYATDENDYVYKTNQTGYSGMVKFLSDNPSMQDLESSENNVRGIFSNNTLLSPDNFGLLRTVNDANDPFLNKRKIHSNTIHYILQQRVQGLPVSFANLSVHQDGEQINAVFGSLITNEQIPQKKLSLSDAERIVADRINAENGETIALTFATKEEIYNGEVTGLTYPDSNHIAAHITAISATSPTIINREMIVDLVTSAILYDTDMIFEAKHIVIKSCSGSSCSVVRDDVSKTSPSGDAEADKSYEILGKVYDFYFTKFGRDSLDNHGATMRGTVHYPSKCPNAYWTGSEMLACTGVVATDVWGHEFTHGVIQSTAHFSGKGSGQNGALNEGFADVFGQAIDSKDWTMGEDLTAPGVPKPLRYLDHPEKMNQPDRIFSPNYDCGGEIHKNDGIINKADYLMTVGGSFNGCTITGVGPDKAIAIMYQALTKGYLSSSSNYRDAYDAITRGCADLTSGGNITTADCDEVTHALQAVEMDQQTAKGKPDAQTSPKCKNPSSVKPATCTGIQPGPTSAPTGGPTTSPMPTGAIPTSIPVVVTPPPGYGIKALQYEESCAPTTTSQTSTKQYKFARYECDNGDTGLVGDPALCTTAEELLKQAKDRCAIIEPTGSTGATGATGESGPTGPTGVPDDEPSPTIVDRQQIELAIKFKLQGVTEMKAYPNRLMIRVGLTNSSTDTIYKTNELAVDEYGNFIVDVAFDADPGNYCVLIKGPYHMQKKICDSTPTESYPGSYQSNRPRIYLDQGQNDLDFTGVLQLAGDLKTQDGIVNSYDTSLCRQNLGNTDAESLSEADVNLDGVVNAQDCSLIYASLAFKFDEE